MVRLRFTASNAVDVQCRCWGKEPHQVNCCSYEPQWTKCWCAGYVLFTPVGHILVHAGSYQNEQSICGKPARYGKNHRVQCRQGYPHPLRSDLPLFFALGYFTVAAEAGLGPDIWNTNAAALYFWRWAGQIVSTSLMLVPSRETKHLGVPSALVRPHPWFL